MYKKCFLCNSTDSIIDFNDYTFKKCLLKLAFRKKKNFKYNDVELTNESLDFVGYHSSCYKKVTCLKKIYSEDYNNFITNYEVLPSTSTADEHPKCLDSSAHLNTTVIKSEENIDEITSLLVNLDKVPSTSTALTCGNQVTCLFCNHKQKKCGKQVLSLIFPQSEQSVQQIITMAATLNDSEILSKLEHQSVAYHKSCYAAYQTKKRRFTEERADSSWHKYRRMHQLACESITNYITKEIIENNQVMYFARIFLRYQALLLEFRENTIDLDDIEDYRSEKLEKKLLKRFGDRITIEASTGPRNQKIVYKTDIDVSIMANNTKFLETKNEQKFEEVAYRLRSCLKNIDHKPLPTHLTAEREIPKKLFDFMQNLIEGPDISNKSSEESTGKVTSICSDIMYVVTNNNLTYQEIDDTKNAGLEVLIDSNSPVLLQPSLSTQQCLSNSKKRHASRDTDNELIEIESQKIEYLKSKQKLKDYEQDLYFFKSILPDLNHLTAMQKIAYRMKILQTTQEFLVEISSSITNSPFTT